MRLVEARRKVIVFDSETGMQSFAAELWAGHCREAVAGGGFFFAAVSGGRTPEGFFRTLTGVADLRWDRTHLFLVDERVVPPTDADSNFRMLDENLLKNIMIPEGNIHRVPVEAEKAEAAERYEQTIRETVPLCSGGIPCFDLVLLGMGEDGHTASLFPGSAALEESSRLVRSVAVSGVKRERVTMTLPLINESRNVVFLVSGAGKAETLREVAVEGNPALPAARVAPRHGSMVILADNAAARFLT